MHLSAKFILRLECKIYFAFLLRSKFILRFFYVPNLFCVSLECKIYFAFVWSANLFCVCFTFQIYFAFVLRSKFILRLFYVPNLFCGLTGMPVILLFDFLEIGRIPKKRVIATQNKFCTPSRRKINFALHRDAK